MDDYLQWGKKGNCSNQAITRFDLRAAVLSGMGFFANHQPSALLLIKDRMRSWCSLMKPNLPTDCGAHPDGGPQRMSMGISATIHVC
jgi:hypothetical protein